MRCESKIYSKINLTHILGLTDYLFTDTISQCSSLYKMYIKCPTTQLILLANVLFDSFTSFLLKSTFDYLRTIINQILWNYEEWKCFYKVRIFSKFVLENSPKIYKKCGIFSLLQIWKISLVNTFMFYIIFINVKMMQPNISVNSF